MAWFFKKSEKRAQEIQPPHEEVKTSACNTFLDQFEAARNKLYNGKYDAMHQSAFFAAVNLISNGIAQMGWDVKSKTDKQITSVPYIDYLFEENNLTRFIFVKNMIKDVLLHGDGFAYIHRGQDGKPITLEYAPWGDTVIEYNPISRVLFYRMPKIKEGLIEPVNVIHLRINSKDGIHGRSILSYAINTIRLDGHAEKSAEEFFGSGMQLQGILSTDQPVFDPEQRKEMQNTWQKSQLGEGSGVAVLEAGMKYQSVSVNTRDAQLLETRQFNITEVARWFNISPVLLGDYSKTAYNTIEQAQLQFVVNTLAPYVMLLEQELNKKIIMPSDKKKFYIDIIEEDIIAQDKQAQATYLTTLVEKGIMTRNEARNKLGLIPVDGGDDLIIAYTDINQNTINKDKNTETEDEE